MKTSVTVEHGKVYLYRDGTEINIGLPIQDTLDSMGTFQAKYEDGTVYVWNADKVFIWTEPTAGTWEWSEVGKIQ